MNLAQGTPEWMKAREKLVTASTVAALFGKHPFKDLRDLIEILRRSYDESSPKEKSFAMSWGTLFEDKARQRYEEATGAKVDSTGFWLMQNAPLLSQKAPYAGAPFCGGSPDGIVKSFNGENGSGIIEIKSPHTSKCPKLLVDNMMHIFQLIMNMYCTGSSWSHFISYTPIGLTVEFCPRPDQVKIGEIDAFQHGEQENWTKHGVYDPSTGKYPGYGRVFFDVIYNFNRAVKTGDKQIARSFAFDYYESIRLVNEVHKKLKDLGFLTVIYQDEKPLPIPHKSLLSRVEWTPMLMWQMKYIATHKESKNKRPWLYRFHMISKTKPHGMTHCIDMVPKVVRKPAWFTMSALCVDIVSQKPNGKFKVKKLTLNTSTNLPQAIRYWKYEQQQLPIKGCVVITQLNNGFITYGAIVPWSLEVENLDAVFFKPILISSTYRLRVDCMHRHVLLERVAVLESADQKSGDNP